MLWLVVTMAALLLLVPRLRGAVARLGLLALLVVSLVPWLGVPSKFEAAGRLNAARDARMAGNARSAADLYEAVLEEHPQSTRALVGYACLALQEGYFDQGVSLLQWAFQEGISQRAFEDAGACGQGQLHRLGIEIIEFTNDRDFLFPRPLKNSSYPDVVASLTVNADNFRTRKDPLSLAALEYDLFCLSNETGNRIMAARYLETALRTAALTKVTVREQESLQECVEKASSSYVFSLIQGEIEVLPRGPVPLVPSSSADRREVDGR